MATVNATKMDILSVREHQPHQQPSRTIGGTGSSYCKPPTTGTAPRPATTPTYTQRSTPTPSPSPQPNSPSPPTHGQDPCRAGKTDKTLPRHPAGQPR